MAPLPTTVTELTGPASVMLIAFGCVYPWNSDGDTLTMEAVPSLMASEAGARSKSPAAAESARVQPRDAANAPVLVGPVGRGPVHAPAIAISGLSPRCWSRRPCT